MLKHNLLIIYRSFKRFKSTFIINLIGLSAGLACAIMIYLWVNDELTVDKFHVKDDRLYQVMENMQLSDRIVTQIYTPDLLAETMAEEIPEVEYASAVTPSSWFAFTLSVDDKNLKAVGQFAGKDFFNIFSYGLVQGETNLVLAEQNTIVISETLAKKLFSTAENVIGKTIEWQLLNFKYKAVVSGICKEPPQNSTTQFDFVLSFDAWKILSKDIGRGIHWGNHAPGTYIILNEGTNVEDFNEKIKNFIKSKDKFSNVILFARPYSEGYLYDKYENGVLVGGKIDYIELFSFIAVFIIIIACINFMNLSTAKASRRIKEVGIKKTVGAQRKTLIFQYLSESIFISFFSVFIALIIVEIFLPQFNLITGKELTLSYNLSFIFTLLGITIFTGLISGSYPALYISGFNPAFVLKGKLHKSAGELWVRKGLVVFQFILSAVLIVSVLVVYKQIDFIQTKNLGYDKDNIIYFEKEGKVADSQEAFLSSIKKLPGVVNASSSGSNGIGISGFTEGVDWEGKSPEDIIRFANLQVNYDLIETLDIEMKEGRTFSRDFGSEESKIIFNEAAIDIMGLNDPVGKVIKLWGSDMEIIGVAKNFHFESLHESLKPMFFKLDPSRTLKIIVRIKSGTEREAIEQLSTLYKEFNLGYSFEYKFLDQEYQVLYDAERIVSILSHYFAGLAIIISCLGLFGLVAFTAEQRTKEIGIRKVLGANFGGLVLLLSKDFLKLVLIAFIIASPLAWYLMNTWLNNFAYRINLSWWMFAIAGGFALAVALITISFQAIKAATANPVKLLRYE